MTVLSLASVFCLFGVFLVAALGKLASPGSARRATEQLGVPTWTASMLVPAELGVIAMLALWPVLGALSAALLLGGFTAVLGRVVRDGRLVSCGCFGSATDEPVSRVTLARNAVLIGLCLPAAFAPQVWSSVGDTVGASLVTAGGLVCVGLLASGLLRMKTTTGAVFAITVRPEV